MDFEFLKKAGRKEAIFLGLPILGVVVGFYLKQTYFNENQITIQQWSLKKELVKKQYPYLNRILRFADLSKYMEDIEGSRVCMNEEGEVIRKDEDFHNYEIPKLCIDKSIQKEWQRLHDEIKANIHKLDMDIYYKFQAVHNFKYSHPFPDTTTFKAIRNSPWIKEDIKNEWIQLNFELWKTTKKSHEFRIINESVNLTLSRFGNLKLTNLGKS